MCIKNFKKAKSYLDNYLDERGLPKQSGVNNEQVIELVLQDMWQHEQSLKNKETEESSEKDGGAAASPSTSVDAPVEELSENDPKYYEVCKCGHANRAACGTCG